MAATAAPVPALGGRTRQAYVTGHRSPGRQTGGEVIGASSSRGYVGPSEVGPTDSQKSDVHEPLIETGAASVESPVHAELSMRFVNGSVVEMLADHVEIACHIGAERVVVHLPKTIVPDELQVYGTPVRLTLSDKSGKRTPLVERREPKHVEVTKEEAEVLAWLEEETR